MKLLRTGLLALAVLASGCAEGIVSARAQRDLGCDDVNVTQSGPGGEWEASGCGDAIDYACITTEGGETSCIREANVETTSGVTPVYVAPAATPPAKTSDFPVVAAASTMKLAATFAADCNAVPGPRGNGVANITFESDGRVSSVVMSEPFQSTPVGECVAQKFRKATIPAFSSGPKVARKSFDVPS